jgi:hypothetical protein
MTSTITPAATIKLSDTQLVLLSQAAQHPERAVTIPERLRGGAVQRVVGPLLVKGLVEAVPNRGEMPVYKVEADGSRLALRITVVGLLALGIEPDAPAGDEAPAEQLDLPRSKGPAGSPNWQGPPRLRQRRRLGPARASLAAAPSRRCSSPC